MGTQTPPVDKRIQTVIFQAGLADSVDIEYSGPQNEEGVKELFRAIAPTIDIDIIVDTEPFPDMIINHREQGPYTLEVECSLSDFIDHGHDPRACHIVLFWDDDRVVLEDGLERDEVPKERKEKIRQLLSGVTLWSLKEIISERTYDIKTGLNDRTF